MAKGGFCAKKLNETKSNRTSSHDTSGWTFEPRQISRAPGLNTGGSSIESGLELAIRRSQGGDSATEPPRSLSCCEGMEFTEVLL
ncbi:hypothetical protein AVEN_3153-1 [Araneus ventricosus]|uniref:Uncharacterized protein n=1 Tax=Araneus ventricosus TaxID=182803 RepID=A0A4Y2P3Y9_ARAVE|nr:hypothetical protein AVEN_3153-1 [Araneus ventricosus]